MNPGLLQVEIKKNISFNVSSKDTMCSFKIKGQKYSINCIKLVFGIKAPEVMLDWVILLNLNTQ